MPEVAAAFRAAAERVVDGDTLVVRVDRHDGDESVWRARLARVDAPERDEPGGEEAAAFVSGWLARAASAGGRWPLVVLLVGRERYGRALLEVWRTIDGECLSDALLARGAASYVPLAEQAPAPEKKGG